MNPSPNDREFDLWFKTATNWYDHAITQGLTGFNPPSLNDTKQNLLKKIAYYTARVAEAS